MTSSTLDPCTSHILSFIRGTPTLPMEAAGNYNAVIGNAHATDDLAQKSLSEIYQLQEQLLAHNRPSSAVGAYQIIYPTLHTLAGKAHLPPDTTFFTPALQDSLAVALLIQRGYSRWWRDHIDNEEFLHRISCEWASLPNPYNGGRSNYDDIGPNHAGCSLDTALDMLIAARVLRKPTQP